MVKIYAHVLTDKRLLDNEVVVIINPNEKGDGTVQNEFVAPLVEKYERMSSKHAGFPATLNNAELKLYSNEKDLKAGTEMPHDKKISDCKLKNKQDVYCIIISKSTTPETPTSPTAKTSTSDSQKLKKGVKSPAEAEKEAKELFKRAEELIEQNKGLREAKMLLARVLELRPNDADALFHLGNIYLQAGGAKRISDARKYMQRGMKASPGRLDFYVAMGDICTLEGNFIEAGKHYQLAIERLARLANSMSGAAEEKIRELLDDVLIKGAEAALKAKEDGLAEKLVVTALQHSQKNIRALLAYATLVHRKSERAGTTEDERCSAAREALQVRLQVVVAQNAYEPARAALAESLRGRYGMRCLKELLKGLDAKGSSVFGFLGGVVKDYGMFEEELALHREELALTPAAPKCCLNIAHAYENLGWLGEAFRAMHEFMRANPALAVHRVTCAHVLRIVGPLAANKYAALTPLRGRPAAPNMESPAPGVLDEAMTAQIGAPPPAGYIYPEDELNLLAMFFTLAKVLYLLGYLQFLPPLIRLLKPLREDRDLHLTLIRNEQAYFACLEKLVEDIAPRIPIKMSLSQQQQQQQQQENQRPIYVVGDSHTLTLGWQSVTEGSIGSDENTPGCHLLRPYLVTGIKIWHLRDDGTFYPKANFWNIVKSIPKGSTVLLIVGEIDCREGILEAVQKCRYETLEEGVREVIAIYKRVLARLQRDRGFRLLVHPAAPVLNETREIVHLFDTILREELLPLQSGTLRFLDIADRLVNDSWTALQERFALDGTHLRANYVSEVLEPAISEALSLLKP